MSSSSATPHKIALFIHALHGGGAERLMSQLATRWAEKGIEVHLVTLDRIETDQYPVGTNVVRHGLGLMGVSAHPLQAVFSFRRRSRALSECLKSIAPQLVISFCDRSNILCLSATKGLRVPTWIAEHSDPTKQVLPFRWRIARERLYPTANGCIALTEEYAEVLSRWIDPRQIAVIPPAIAPPRLQKDLRETCTTNSKEPLVILSMGRLSREKNVGSLIAAWYKIENQLPGWRLDIAGDGPERPSLESQAASMTVRDRVRFLGWVDAPYERYARASLFALSSHYEGVPLSLLEAMASAVPCIATPCCQTVMKFAAQNSVLVCREHSVSSLGQSILDLAENPQLREDLSSQAPKATEPFSWEVVGGQWDRLLSRILSTS